METQNKKLGEYLRKETKFQNEKLDIISELKQSKKLKKEYQIYLISKLKSFTKVVLYGTSESSIEALKFFKKNRVVVDAIYDDDPAKANTYFFGVPVVKPKFTCKGIAIVVCVSFYDVIKDKFLKHDPNISKRLFVFDGYFAERLTIGFYKKHIKQIESCFNGLADPKSKDLFIALLKYRYVRDVSLIKNLYEHRKECYFDKVFLDNFENGLYVDAGSYNADFITELERRKDTKGSTFYIFEPNRKFYNEIKTRLSNIKRYKVFQVALCDEKGQKEFRLTNTSTSHLFEKKYNAYKNTLQDETEYVQTDTLDNIVGKAKITGIKVDIEGSEKAMLIGAEKTIKRDRPMILLSVYHRASDIFELQSYIQSMNLNYKFYLRHYSLNVAKTILYCIPD